MTAQLSWKRALEDSSPVMVNGSVGPTAELHQGDPFHQNLFQENQPKELKETAPVSFQQKEHSDEKEKDGVDEKEEEQEKEVESLEAAEEDKPKPDPLDDLYTSLGSSDMYSALSTHAKPRESAVRVKHHSYTETDIFSLKKKM